MDGSRLTSLSVLVLGDACTGKSSLVQCLRGELATVDYQPTMGTDSCTIRYQADVPPVNVELTVWDTSGNDRFLSPFGFPFVEADVCVLVCDVGSRESLTHLSTWHDEFLQSTHVLGAAPAAFVVVANKIDITERAVSSSEVIGWCSSELVDPTLWVKELDPSVDPTPSFVETCTRDRRGLPTLLQKIAARGLLRRRMSAALLSRNLNFDADLFAWSGTTNGLPRCLILGDISSKGASRCLRIAPAPPHPQPPSSASSSSANAELQDGHPLSIEAIQRCNVAAAVMRCGNERFALWTGDTAAPMWFARGAHVCLVWMSLGAAVPDLHQIGLCKAVLMRESALRMVDSVLWVVVGERLETYQANIASEVHRYCSSHGFEFLDVAESATDAGLLELWTTVGQLLSLHRQRLVMDRAEEHSVSGTVLCPNSRFGCPWSGKPAQLGKHAEHECGFCRAQCRFEGCVETMCLRDRALHERCCPHRPPSCHFCEMPYGSSLAEHLKRCVKRLEFEKTHVACPLADFGCPVRYVERGDVATHLAADAPAHMELLAQGLLRSHHGALETERALRLEMEKRETVLRREANELRDELSATKAELRSCAEQLTDMRIEMKLVWEELEWMRKERRAALP